MLIFGMCLFLGMCLFMGKYSSTKYFLYEFDVSFQTLVHWIFLNRQKIFPVWQMMQQYF